MVLQITETYGVTVPFEANASKTIKLPTMGYVTRYEILLHLNISTDSTDGGTPNEDALARIIKSLRIEVPGQKVYFGIPDGRLLKYKNIAQFGKVYEDDLPTAAGVTEDVYAKYVINWGFHPNDPFDPTVVLPAGKISDLYFTILWGDAGDLGTGYTINSGEIKITQRYLQLEEGESEEDIFPEGYVEPVMHPVEVSINEVKPELGLTHNLPLGNVLVETLILVVDSSDNKSDEEVSEFGILFPRQKATPIRYDWKSALTQFMEEYGLPSYIKGFYILDYEDVSGIPIGLDMSLMEEGEVQLGFSTLRTGGKIKMAHFQVT